MLRSKNKNRTILTICFFVLCLALFIVPQVVQQLFYDQIPATGDIIHKRFVYFLTNFPDFYSQALLTETGHSKLYFYQLSLSNIVSGLTGMKTFYGFGIVTLISLVMTFLLVWNFSKRMSKKYAFIGPLLFLGSPLLMAPYLGQADMHLIYFFLGMVLFIIFFAKPAFGSQLALLTILAGTLNSHFMIWLPLFLMVLILEAHYPKFRSLLFLPLGVILTWAFLKFPISYLSGISSDFLFWATVFSALAILGFYKIRQLNNHRSKSILFFLGIAALLFFMIPKQGSSVYSFASLSSLWEASSSFRNVNLWHFIFTINPSKGIPGLFVHSFILLALSLPIIHLWRKKNIELKMFHTLFYFIVVPLGIILLKFVLLTIHYEYFVKSPLGALHGGRLNVIFFFFLPFLFIYILDLTQKKWFKFGLLVLSFILVVNAANTSYFYFLRVIPDATQSEYQLTMQESLEKGDSSFSRTEAEYACHFYDNCNL